MKANEVPEYYPIQFRDKIDEYLWKEHHILGGCCSSVESMKYAVAREIAEKLTDAFIDKACDWLKNNLYNYAGEDDKRNIVPFDDAIFEDFKNAMEGE